MQPIEKAWFCQIELTNVCTKACAYCTRYVHHLRKDQRFFMSLSVLESALNSLRDWPNGIGVIGGEPTLHPDFEHICAILRRYYPPEKLGLWTSGGTRFDHFRQVIADTFGFISHNEHNQQQQELCSHQPLTIAINDVVADPAVRRSLIDDCWVQKKWCPSISPKGSFFCEIACSIDLILDGPGGWPIENGWWKREVAEYDEQIERYCGHCGMCVPLAREPAVDLQEKSHRHITEYVSPGLLTEFRKLNLRNISEQNITVFERNLSIEEMDRLRVGWAPENYREDLGPSENISEDSPNDDSWLMTTAEFFRQYKANV